MSKKNNQLSGENAEHLGEISEADKNKHVQKSWEVVRFLLLLERRIHVGKWCGNQLMRAFQN